MAEADDKELAASARMYWAKEGYGPGGVIKEVDWNTQKDGVHPLFEGIKIVDTDTHLTEAPDLFVSRAPEKFKHRVPVMKPDAEGVDRWYMDGNDCGTQGGAVIGNDYNKLLGRLAFPTVDDGHAAAYSIKPRLQMMDDMGVHAQICYQNSGITQPGMLMMHGDIEAALMTLTIYNEASMEFQEESGQRIFNMEFDDLF